MSKIKSSSPHSALLSQFIVKCENIVAPPSEDAEKAHREKNTRHINQMTGQKRGEDEKRERTWEQRRRGSEREEQRGEEGRI